MVKAAVKAGITMFEPTGGIKMVIQLVQLSKHV
nr:hypothetical protein [Pectinatus frisingensis]